VGAIEAAGAEPHVGDPDRVATLTAAFEHAGVACILLGSATGTREQLAELHGPRLEMLLSRMLDTTIRGIVYEAAGTVEAPVLRRGAETVRRVCLDSMIPHEIVTADPADHATWTAEAAAAADGVLGGRSA
jgi:hypothetical protein